MVKGQLILLAMSFTAALTAQTTLVAGGASCQPGGAPACAATGLYAHLATGSTWAYAVYDVVPTRTRPVQVTQNVGLGVAYKAFTLGTVGLWVPAAAGPSWTGSALGWEWTTGALATIPTKWKGFMLCPGVRMVKSSVNAGTGYSVIGSVMVGWGF